MAVRVATLEGGLKSLQSLLTIIVKYTVLDSLSAKAFMGLRSAVHTENEGSRMIKGNLMGWSHQNATQ